MPIKGRKFISEFLLPNLDKKKFGSRLKWLNIEEAIFQLQWNHKSASDWKEIDAQVFIEWDKIKGHYRPDEKEYYTKSKQRFRAVLYKLIQEKQITELGSKDKSTKIYCLGQREKSEFDNVMHFKPNPSASYFVENPLDSVIEDHRYSQSEQVVSEKDDDMVSFYPIQTHSLNSPKQHIDQNIDPVATTDDKLFNNHQDFMQPNQDTLYLNYIIIPKDYSLSNNSLRLEDYIFLQNDDGEASMNKTASLLDATLNNSATTPGMFCDYGDLVYSNCT